MEASIYKIDHVKKVKIENIILKGPSDPSKVEVSYQKVEANKINFENPILASNFKKELSTRDLQTEFQTLYTICNTEEHEKRLHNPLENQAFNRYIDILPYQDTMIVLNQRPLQPKTDTYINANYIHSPLGLDKKIIAAQGPKSNTVENFWRMVIQENVTLIVCVCKLTEGGRSKCHKYWPDEKQDFPEKAHEKQKEFSVKTEKEEEYSSNFLVRKFTIQSKERKQNVTQLHYTGWPDHGNPSLKSREEFEAALNDFIDFVIGSPADQKAIVHCSAGIGRTGTIITLMHVIINIHAQRNAGITDPGISIFGTVRRLREQRLGIVQMQDQYRFIYEFLADWLAKQEFK